MSEKGRVVLAARAIVLHRGHVLLLRCEEPGRTFYFLPGGMVKPGETLQAACEREVLEETGIRVNARRILYLREFIAARHSRLSQSMPRQHHVLAAIFLCDVEGEQAAREPAKLGKFQADAGAKYVTGLEWFRQSELGNVELHPPHLRNALQGDFPPPADMGVQFWPED